MTRHSENFSLKYLKWIVAVNVVTLGFGIANICSGDANLGMTQVFIALTALALATIIYLFKEG